MAQPQRTSTLASFTEIRMLQNYIVHWRNKECWNYKDTYEESEKTIVLKVCLVCATLNQVLDEYTDFQCPFYRTKLDSKEAFFEHLQKYAGTKTLVTSLIKASNRFVRFPQSTEDIHLGFILNFTRNSAQELHMVQKSTECPLCLTDKGAGLPTHLKSHAGTVKRQDPALRERLLDLVERFCAHCLICHQDHFYTELNQYLERCKAQDSTVETYETLFSSVQDAIFDLEVLQKRCKDPPYEFCTYCTAFKAIFLNELNEHGAIICVREGVVSFPCRTLHCNYSFPSIRMLIRHLIYVKMEVIGFEKDTEMIKRKTDPLCMFVCWAKHFRRTHGLELVPGCVECSRFGHMNIGLPRKCFFCPEIRSPYKMISHFLRIHGQSFNLNQPMTPEELFLFNMFCSLHKDQPKTDNQPPSRPIKTSTIYENQNRKNSAARALERDKQSSVLQTMMKVAQSFRKLNSDNKLMATFAFISHFRDIHDSDFAVILKHNCAVCRQLKSLLSIYSPHKCQLCNYEWQTPNTALRHLLRHATQPLSHFNRSELLLVVAQFCRHFLRKHHESIIDPQCAYCNAFHSGRFQKVLALALTINTAGVAFIVQRYECLFIACARSLASPSDFFGHLIGEHLEALEQIGVGDVDLLQKAFEDLRHKRGCDDLDCVRCNVFKEMSEVGSEVKECMICLEQEKDSLMLHFMERHIGLVEGMAEEEEDTMGDFFEMDLQSFMNIASKSSELKRVEVFVNEK